MQQDIQKALQKIVSEFGGNVDIQLETPKDLSHGDLTTNIAMILSKNLGKNPRELAEEIVKKLEDKSSELRVKKVEVAGPGFINFWFSKNTLDQNLKLITEEGDHFGNSGINNGKKVMVEFAHPNTHKELHIGHMRTLITGEAIARLFEATGAQVFRANYQGDIGPHVAKAIYGIKHQDLTIEEIEKKSHAEKAHFLGKAYADGSAAYENPESKAEIDRINQDLYEKKDSELNDLYEKTRQWSLDYYDDFYHDFYTKFDKLFFESEMAERGVEIVKAHVGDVFVEDEGVIIFPGKKYGLHNRVFITSRGNPTYEGKEMANAEAEYNAFPFDKKIHVVGSEQAGYFQVVFKALEMLDPAKYKDKQFHVSMGMVQFTDRKMSSRTGDILRVDWLIDEVRKKVSEIVKDAKINKESTEEVINQVTIGAIKYSVLKVGTGQDVAFNIDQSVALDGNSGPYLQYTYARTQSVINKIKDQSSNIKAEEQNLNPEEDNLLRLLTQFPGVVIDATEKMSPNLVANYLFELAQLFNLFYQKHKIIGSSEEQFRLILTNAVGQTLKNGLHLLGIQAPVKM